MDGFVAHHLIADLDNGSAAVPGTSFGDAPLPARALDPGMGVAVARRTVFRPDDREDFGRVADRVALGNMSLLRRSFGMTEKSERARLRNAIATGALITSGRHLQHGDADQASRNMEVFTNCSTSITSFAKFYLLLNGSGVGRAYDDDLMAVDWANAPDVLFYLSPEHKDFPRDRASLHRFASEMQLLPWGSSLESFDDEQAAVALVFISRKLMSNLSDAPAGAMIYRIDDSREGWAKSVEHMEAMAFRGERDRTLVLDLSDIRPYGSPIAGMQGRPASGPISLLRGLLNLRQHVIEAARLRDPAVEEMQPWEQALRADHYLSVEVQVGGARRAARMATKSWRDPGALRFVRLKAEGGLWTANHSLMVDQEFWDLVRSGDPADPLARHAQELFAEASRCSYINGEPGFINGDQLEDNRTGSARTKPVVTDGSDFGSDRYKVSEGTPLLLAELSRLASVARFPVTTNPCGEIVLHVTGGYCVIADYAPLLACPVEIEALAPGAAPADVAALWDARVEDSVRLGVRFLMRANTMNALYSKEVARTNRIGIGPTGLHEYAWMRFGLDFNDLLDLERSAHFWDFLARLSDAAKEEAAAYAAELGVEVPVTVTTVKPAGTTSKLFGLTEGAHLPARRQYLRWVQFRGEKTDGAWREGADPLLADYEGRGYPVRQLKSFPGMSIVGFPTLPRIQRLGLGERLVTAPEASPQEQYNWLMLLERFWIGAERGNQVSYTLKVFTDRFELDEYRQILLENQPRVRCCSVLPSKPDHQLGYEYLPEEQVPAGRFAAILEGINDPSLHEAIDMAHLACASGVCPI